MTVHEEQTLLKTLVRLTTKTELGANKASDACVDMTQPTMPKRGLADHSTRSLDTNPKDARAKKGSTVARRNALISIHNLVHNLDR